MDTLKPHTHGEGSGSVTAMQSRETLVPTRCLLDRNFSVFAKLFLIPMVSEYV